LPTAPTAVPTEDNGLPRVEKSCGCVLYGAQDREQPFLYSEVVKNNTIAFGC
jgi:hypothetical protein